MQQIQIMEAEISKLQKNLDSSKLLYQGLNKQYIEQCSASRHMRILTLAFCTQAVRR